MKLERIKAREAAATPGPWDWEQGRSDDIPLPINGQEPVALLSLRDSEQYGYVTEAADADFIAHAREDVPALVAEVERLRSEVFFLAGAILTAHRLMVEGANGGAQETLRQQLDAAREARSST